MAQGFSGQRSGEEVVFVFRRHLMTARKGLVFCLLMVGVGVVPFLIWPGDGRMFWVFLGFVVVGGMGWVYSYILWYFSIYVVTNQRVRQVSQKGLFRKSVVDLDLARVHSVSYSVPGVMGGIFGYGTLLIQTAVGDLVVSSVARPEKVYNILQDAMGRGKVDDEEDS
jgi:uncharacterized membrane protein YdbT with pleckstrin-like domain